MQDIIESTKSTQSQKPLSQARMRIAEKIKELGYETQNTQLFELGFTKYSQNLRLLRLHQGQLEPIVQYLQQKPAKKSQEENGDQVKEGKPKREKREKKEKKEKKPKKERMPVIETKELTEWPAHIRTLYLDGNNMLFVEDAIRRMMLGRKKKLAEQVLADLAFEFAQAIGTFNVILIFDSTKQISSQEIVAPNGNTVKFSVVSSTPEFTNSDDALVAWSEKLGDKANECFFVTSDRGLQVRLSQNGVENISKTKRWFNLVKTTIGEEKYNAVLNQN